MLMAARWMPCAVAAALHTCGGSEAGSYLRLIDNAYHSTLGLRVIKKKREDSTPAETCAQSTSSDQTDKTVNQ